MRNSKVKAKAKKKPSPVEDIYKGVHPELARIARAQNAKPFDMDRKRAKFLTEDKTWEGFEDWLRKLRHADVENQKRQNDLGND